MAELTILGGMLLAGYVAVRLAEEEEPEPSPLARHEAAGLAQLVVATHSATGLVDATWSGSQDVRVLVEAVDRRSGATVGSGHSKVAHDGGTAPVWPGDRGLVSVPLPRNVALDQLRVLVTLYSEAYVTEDTSLGHAETTVDADLPPEGATRSLEIDPRGTVVVTVASAAPASSLFPLLLLCDAPALLGTARRAASRGPSRATARSRRSGVRRPRLCTSSSAARPRWAPRWTT